MVLTECQWHFEGFCCCCFYALFKKDFIYLFMYECMYVFIFREWGRVGERERNISVWLSLIHPQLGTWPQPRLVS